MENATVDSMCRCCAAEGMFKDIKTSYHWMGEEEVYGDMLRECFDVKLASVEEGGICEVCITQLRNAANFKKQVLHTEKKFKRHLENRRFKTAEVKEELSGDNDNSSDDNDRGADSEEDEDYVPEFEIPIKTESPEESKSRKRAAKATTSRAKKSRVADEDKSAIFNTCQLVKIELTEGPTVEVPLVKVEAANDEPAPSIQTWERPIEPATSETETETTTQRLLIIHPPAKRRKRTIQRIRIKPPTEPAPMRQIKIKPPTTGPPVQPTRRKIIKNDPPLLKKEIKIEPPSSMPKNYELDKHRHNIRTILKCSNATPIRCHYIGSGYVCCFCKASFLKAADLKSHTINDHDDAVKSKFMKGIHLFSYIVKLDITSLYCSLCDTPVDTLEQLMDHLNEAHQKGLHTDIKSHIACFKLDDDAMTCHICSTKYQSFKLLFLHMNQHFTNFICAECGSGFINRNQLKNHSTIHNVGEFKCESCDKVLNSMKKLRCHMRQTHTGISLYKCHQCDERFKTKNAKHNHIQEAHGIVLTELQCDACDRTFKNNDALRTHKKRDHLMERRFECDICGHKFFGSGTLKDHKVTHTGLRDFKCELCSKSYSRRDGLREHMRSHTDDRRFKCTYCGMAFLQKCSLKGHLRSRHDAELQ